MKTEPRKARLIKWLEEETGKTLESSTTSGQDRHVSVRLPTSLYERLESIASGSDESVSQTIRRLLTGVTAPAVNPDAAALDTAIAALQELRRRSA